MPVSKPIFITTSIAYINAEPHIGFLFELLAADVLKKQYQLAGEQVFLLTGTDEHGAKVARAAEDKNQDPQEYADQLSEKYRRLGGQFGIDFDYFIRTTEPKHQRFVQNCWRQLGKNGYLEKRTYTGFYCLGCEAFKTERELEEGNCLIHRQPVEKVTEENWFFLLTKLKDKIQRWLSESVIEPAGRLKEIRRLVEELEDVSFSRPIEKLSWGIPVPDDRSQVMYVWTDALLNYLSALEIVGRPELWPADIQIIGKDILRFHAAIWPGLLLALNRPLPKKLLVHGFIKVDGRKISKTLGNVITPRQLLERYKNPEAVRYLLFRQLPFFEDGNFVWLEFDALYTGELANGLGNLAARLIGLRSLAKVNSKIARTLSSKPSYDFAALLNQANQSLKEADRLISESRLWQGTEGKIATLDQATALFVQAVDLLEPFMPETAAKIRRQLIANEPAAPLFPRLT